MRMRAVYDPDGRSLRLGRMISGSARGFSSAAIVRSSITLLRIALCWLPRCYHGWLLLAQQADGRRFDRSCPAVLRDRPVVEEQELNQVPRSIVKTICIDLARQSLRCCDHGHCGSRAWCTEFGIPIA